MALLEFTDEFFQLFDLLVCMHACKDNKQSVGQKNQDPTILTMLILPQNSAALL